MSCSTSIKICQNQYQNTDLSLFNLKFCPEKKKLRRKLVTTLGLIGH